MNTALLMFCLMAAFFSTGESLLCYLCHEERNESCNDLSFSYLCSNAVYCAKDIQYKNGNLKIVNRHCISHYNIYTNKWTEEGIESANPMKLQVDGKKVELHHCKTDYCNSASVTKATLAILSFVIIFVQYYF